MHAYVFEGRLLTYFSVPLSIEDDLGSVEDHIQSSTAFKGGDEVGGWVILQDRFQGLAGEGLLLLEGGI